MLIQRLALLWQKGVRDEGQIVWIFQLQLVVALLREYLYFQNQEEKFVEVLMNLGWKEVMLWIQEIQEASLQHFIFSKA